MSNETRASLSDMDLFEALTSDRPQRHFISIKVIEDKLILVTGDLDIISLPIVCFNNIGSDVPHQPDLSKLELVDLGQTIKMGKCEISAELVFMLPTYLFSRIKDKIQERGGDSWGVSSDPESIMSLASLAFTEFEKNKTLDSFARWSNLVFEVEDLVENWEASDRKPFSDWIEDQVKLIDLAEKSFDNPDNGMYTEGYL